MEAMFDDVGSKSHPRGVRIHSFRENRRLGDPFWRQDGNINFSKTRPESAGIERLGGNGLGRRRRRGPGRVRKGINPSRDGLQS